MNVKICYKLDGTIKSMVTGTNLDSITIEPDPGDLTESYYAQVSATSEMWEKPYLYSFIDGQLVLK